MERIKTNGKPVWIHNAMGEAVITSQEVTVDGVMDIRILDDEKEAEFLRNISQLNMRGLERLLGIMEGMLLSKEFRKDKA